MNINEFLNFRLTLVGISALHEAMVKIGSPAWISSKVDTMVC